MVGLQLQLNQQQQLTNELLLQHGPGGSTAGVPSRASSMPRHDPREAQQQQQQSAAPQGPPAQTNRRQSSSGGSAQPQRSFIVTSKDLKDMSQLLQLFEKGWPLQVPDKTYEGLADPSFGKGLPDNQQQQYELLRQGYLLIQAVSEQYRIGMDQAAQVVEFWRKNSAARIDRAGGTISEAPALGSVLPPDSEVAQSLLPAASLPTSGKYTINQLCQTARNLPCVKDKKNSQKSAAGTAGGRAAKRRRTSNQQQQND